MLQQRELAEAIQAVQIETKGRGNGVNSEWQKAIVERLKQHVLTLQDASTSFQKWSEAHGVWTERIQRLETTW